MCTDGLHSLIHGSSCTYNLYTGTPIGQEALQVLQVIGFILYDHGIDWHGYIQLVKVSVMVVLPGFESMCREAGWSLYTWLMRSILSRLSFKPNEPGLVSGAHY